MPHFTYFAYGSNMLTERLQARCPSAEVISKGWASGYELTFSKKCGDGSGKATLSRVEEQTRQIPGVVFRILSSELTILDRFESKGNGYDRVDDFEVITPGGSVPAVTYIAPSHYRDATMQPYDWYRALVLAGALQHGFDEEYVKFLRQTAAKPDPMLNRDIRLHALELLEKNGYSYLLDEPVR